MAAQPRRKFPDSVREELLGPAGQFDEVKLVKKKEPANKNQEIIWFKPGGSGGMKKTFPTVFVSVGRNEISFNMYSAENFIKRKITHLMVGFDGKKLVFKPLGERVEGSLKVRQVSKNAKNMKIRSKFLKPWLESIKFPGGRYKLEYDMNTSMFYTGDKI